VTGVLPAPVLSRRRRFTVLAALYLVADIGHSFLLGALTMILVQRGVGLEQLALVNLLGLLYFGRFLVGPVIDRLGHYRRWLVGTQVPLVAVWLAMVPLDPVDDLTAVLALMAVALAVAAVHDTAMSGLAVRLLPPADRGLGNGIQTGMACVSIVLGSGGALLLYVYAGWGVTVGVLAVLFLVPFGVLLFVPEPATEPTAPRTPLFRQRRTLTWAVLVVPVFALGLYLVSAVQSPMLLAAGWSLGSIALVQGTLSGLVGLVAGIGAGALMTATGRRRAAITTGGFSVFALALTLPLSLGGSVAVLDAVAVLAVTAAYAGAAVCVFAVSMDLARPASAATDFTLQISVLGVLRVVTSSAGLGVAGAIGFPALTGVAVLCAALGTWTTARWLRGHTVKEQS
jgi:MFS family permease